MAARPLPSGLITFLFTDIEGSTALSARAGDGFADVIDRHHHIMRAAITANGGVEVSTEGDAFFVVFGAPDDAIAAAVAAQQALSREAWPAGPDVLVRMGLHTGHGQLGGDSYAGYDVNLAARVGASGHGGQVVLSDASWSLVQDRLPVGVSGIVLGEHRLKDIGSPVLLHQLAIDGLPAQFPPLHADRPGGLPEAGTALVGREEELAVVGDLLERSRIVTLTGPGGSGKTRLALAAAQAASAQATAGAWFVPLDGLRDPVLVLPAMAAALEVPEQAGRPLEVTLAGVIAKRPHLLVLDNFEQVVDAGPAIAELVRDAPGLRVIVTSRLPLRITGEQEYAVPTLDRDAAIALFEARAKQVRPDYDSGDDPAAVERLVDRLDRLPLAIELAAARVRAFGPAGILDRLDDRLTMLSSGARDAPSRQRTLAATIEWSFGLLSDPERLALMQLSVFRSGFDLDGAEAIVGPDALLLLDSLVEQSMLTVTAPSDGGQRFRSLDTIRRFAVSELAALPEPHAAAVVAHIGFMADRAESLERRFDSPDLSDALDAAERDHDDYRAAMDRATERGDIHSGLRIGASLWRLWHQRGHLAEGRTRLETLVAEPRASDDPLAFGRALRGLGAVCFWLGDVDTARERYLEAFDALDGAGDLGERAGALFDLSWTRIAERDVGAARAGFEEALIVFEEAGETYQANRVRAALVSVAIRDDDWDAADAAFGPMLEEARATGMPWVVGERLGLGCIVSLHFGRVEEAHVIAVEASDLIVAGGPGRWAGWIEGRAALAVAEGQPERAARWLGALQRMRDDGEGILLSSEMLGIDSPERAARAALDDDYERHFAQGRDLTAREAWLETLVFD